ncbi:unnamed protein product [Hermetia illucens]|uniref:Protein-glucosylgalactosylhydroxylysine glucosidase n=1 Tax=Hermetia illucens TaxID=343691 RepID=A0A7R8YMR6_HERIL|nr:unnamed protein product [Hermetia illucens]
MVRDFLDKSRVYLFVPSFGFFPTVSVDPVLFRPTEAYYIAQENFSLMFRAGVITRALAYLQCYHEMKFFWANNPTMSSRKHEQVTRRIPKLIGLLWVSASESTLLPQLCELILEPAYVFHPILGSERDEFEGLNLVVVATDSENGCMERFFQIVSTMQFVHSAPIVTIVCLLAVNAVTVCLGAINTSLPFVFYTEELPDDPRLMPTIGNGHIGLTLLSDSVYMNGVYSGKAGLSHRARIPNFSNISVMPAAGNYTISYSLNVETAIFQINIENNDMKIIHIIYAHRYYNRAIVNQIYIYRTHNEGSLKLNVQHKPGKPTTDIDFSDPPLTIETSESEYEQNLDVIRNNQTTIHLIQGYTAQITLTPDQRFASYRFVMTVDELCSVAKQEITDVLGRPNKKLLKLHRSEWVEFWNSFRIRIEDNLELEKAIYGSLFYIASSLPSFKTNHPTVDYYGLSPTGLGRGGVDLLDYEGHSFWDTEIWMFPVVMQMDPRWARQLLNYRYRMLDAARDHANKTGYLGARFPWESAYTGTEVTQPCCPVIAQQQIHITADISFAAKNYFALTNDLEWLNNEGCPLVENIAEFLADRVTYNVTTGQYDIKYVMGPDEDHVNVTNNVFTNVVTKNALYFADLALPACNVKRYKKHPSWTTIADKIKVPYDEKNDYHPQYDGFTRDIVIKQADAVLLAYPLMYPMSQTTRRNDLKFYENCTRNTGPAMTWAIHSINHLDNGDYLKADINFRRGYRDYIRQPFQVWSEVIRGEFGATNFITGAGGFLQSIINGYAGVRIHFGCMEIRKPRIPPNCNKFSLMGIKYLGSTFKISIDDTGIFFQCLSLNVQQSLKLYDGIDTYDIGPNLIFNITMDRILIKPTRNIFGSKLRLKDLWKINRN